MTGSGGPLRILMISDFYPPVLGGMERHVQTQARELVRRGHHVAVATLRGDDQPAVDDDEGVTVYRLHGWHQHLRPFYQNERRQFHPTIPDPGVMRQLSPIVHGERPDIVHARGWMIYSFLPLKRFTSVKLVVTLHDYSLACVKKTYIRAGKDCDGPAYAKCVSCAVQQYGWPKSLALTSGLHVSKTLHGVVDHYIAIGETVRAASRPYTGGRSMTVIPSFVPDSTMAEAETASRPDFLPPDDNYILFVGALGKHKGLDVLLHAYQSMDRRVPLVVIGTPQMDTPTQFPKGVIVARNVPHSGVMGAWRHCLFGVAPSVWQEPFGQVAIEAMACGKAIIASRVGGMADVVVDGETGILVPPRDPIALQEAMVALIDDPDRRTTMGIAGRPRSALFTASVITDRVEAVYRAVLT